MRTYILIGGVGSGKSSVAGLLSQHGACVLDLDEVGHDVLGLFDVREALVDRFGCGILAPDGAIDRRSLASCAFASADDLAYLNAVTHPPIVQRACRALERLERQGCQVAVVEVSAYQGPGGAFDQLAGASQGIIAVTAPDALRRSRALASGMDASDLDARMRLQPNDAQRMAWATYCVPNIGTRDQLAQRVEALWDAIGTRQG